MGLDILTDYKTKEFVLSVNDLTPGVVDYIKEKTKKVDTEVCGIVFKCKSNSDYIDLAAAFLVNKYRSEHELDDGKILIGYRDWGEKNLRGTITLSKEKDETY